MAYEELLNLWHTVKPHAEALVGGAAGGQVLALFKSWRERKLARLDKQEEKAIEQLLELNGMLLLVQENLRSGGKVNADLRTYRIRYDTLKHSLSLRGSVRAEIEANNGRIESYEATNSELVSLGAPMSAENEEQALVAQRIGIEDAIAEVRAAFQTEAKRLRG